MLELLPLLVFTTCCGIAAGAYAISVLAALCVPDRAVDGVGAAAQNAPENANADTAAAKDGRSWLFPLVCIILLGVGLLGTLMHLGQPLRFMNGMANPASMISQESYWAIAFGVLMVIDLLLLKTKGQPMQLIRWLAALAGCGLMFVTGLAYFDCTFVTAWSDAVTILLFIVGDLALGTALCMIFAEVDEARCLHILNVAFSAAWFAVACAYGVLGGALGIQVGVIVAGAILGPIVSGAASIASLQGKLPQRTAAIVILASAALGVLLVRGAFFVAGVL